MNYFKGVRFGFPLIRRIGIIEDRESRRVAWNCHTGCEFHYVLHGRFAWEVQGERDTLNVPGGNFAILPPGLNHRAADEVGPPSVRIGVICEPQTARQTLGTAFTPDDLRNLFENFSAHALSVRPITSSLLDVLRRTRAAITAFHPERPETALHLRILCELLFVETARVLKAEDAIRHNDRLIPKICEWIDAHLTDRITSDRLVSLSGYGRSRFFALFNAVMGTPPNDYIIRRRIEHAQTLLKSHPDESIESIARRSGFNSSAFFCNTFRKLTGKTPSACRLQKETKEARHSSPPNGLLHPKGVNGATS